MRAIYLAAAMVLLGIVVGCGGIHEPELHLIPDGFVGEVAVVRDPHDGAATVYEGRFRVLSFGAEGVCRTRGAFTGGWYLPDIGPLPTSRIQYYYVSPDGQRKRIRHVWHRMNELLDSTDSDDEVSVLVTTGTATFSDSGCAHDVQFESYSVGNKAYFRSDWKPFDAFSYFHLHPVRCGDTG